MHSLNVIKIIGLATTLVGMGAEFLSNWVEERKLDEKIDEKIDKALKEREKES